MSNHTLVYKQRTVGRQPSNLDQVVKNSEKQECS